MANLIVGVDVPQAPMSTRATRGNVFVGRHRKMIKKLLMYAEYVQSADTRAFIAGGNAGYNAAEFAVSKGSTTDRALKHIIARAKEAMAQKM